MNLSNVNNALFVVDTMTGSRQILIDFDNPGQGPAESIAQGIAPFCQEGFKVETLKTE